MLGGLGGGLSGGSLILLGVFRGRRPSGGLQLFGGGLSSSLRTLDRFNGGVRINGEDQLVF